LVFKRYFGTLTQCPRRKRPMDFSSQKFCNETSLGQNGLGTKQSLDRTSSANLRQNIPIFRDGLSVPENKQFFVQNVPDPQKNTHLDFSHIFYCTCSIVPIYNSNFTKRILTKRILSKRIFTKCILSKRILTQCILTLNVYSQKVYSPSVY
jgi:hypothetical protein